MRSSVFRLTQGRFIFAVCLLLGAMFALQMWSAATESQTVDEGTHLAAGYSYWITGDFRLNPEHPPLLKLMSSVPLLALPIHAPIDGDAWKNADQWAYAREFLYRNTVPADTLLFWGRLTSMLFGLGLGALIALWSWRLWGAKGGLVSLLLFAFDPAALAHSRYVTTDVAVSFFFLLTVFLFGRFMASPHWKTAVPVWVAFALAQLTKFSAVLLLPILVCIWIAIVLTKRERRSELGLKTTLGFFAGMIALTSVLMFAVYGFELKRPIEDPHVARTYATEELWEEGRYADLPAIVAVGRRLSDPSSASGKWLRHALATVSVPAYTYFRGLSDVVWHNYWGHDSYLFGNYGSRGWWWYFPFAFLVKTPLATLLIFLLTALLFVHLFWQRLRLYKRHPDEGTSRCAKACASIDSPYLLLIIPPIVYGVFSIASHLNLGVRHLLPVYPFFFIMSGAVACVWFSRKRFAQMWRLIIAGLLAIVLVSSFSIAPHYLSYFSEIVGGAENGARYLTDSNLDWGQELKRLGLYMEKSGIPFVYMTYFGQAPMEYYLPDVRYLPGTDEPARIAELDGWAAISATALYEKSDRYAWLEQRKPDAKIGYAIFLYDLRKGNAGVRSPR